MHCKECGIELTENDSYYKSDNSEDLYCYECANEFLKVPFLPTAIDSVKALIIARIRNLKKLDKIELIVLSWGCIVFPAMAIIVPGAWKVVYLAIGAIYWVLFSLFVYYKFKEKSNNEKGQS